MDRPHCDRCDTIIEPFPSWVEVLGLWADTGTTHIVHIRPLDAHSHRPPPAFCLSCWVRILRQYCDELMPVAVAAPPAPVAISAPPKKVRAKKVRATRTTVFVGGRRGGKTKTKARAAMR
jgi:hypothetical protein